jgi:hypothetical protein
MAITPPALRNQVATSGSTVSSSPGQSSRVRWTTLTLSSAAWSPRSTRTASRARRRSSSRRSTVCDFVKNYLWDHTTQGFDVNLNPVTVQHSGLAQIWAGAAAASFFGVPVGNGHYPDVFGKVQEGIVYSGPTKLAEHGGMNTGDTHVLMVVNGPGLLCCRLHQESGVLYVSG